MDIHKINVKFFLANAQSVDPDQVIPLFHRWIQAHRVEGLLIDVADYEHVPNSTGICLIGHEADYYLDKSEGPLGLMYARKQAFDGPAAADLTTRLTAAFKSALTACNRFEVDYKDPAAASAPPTASSAPTPTACFNGSQALVIFNDRLNAPNDDATFAALKPALTAVASKLYAGKPVEITRVKNNPRQRLTVKLKAGGSEGGPAALLARLS